MKHIAKRCNRMGVGGKAIPPYIDRITNIESDAQFIILVEKEAAYLRLAEDRFNCNRVNHYINTCKILSEVSMYHYYWQRTAGRCIETFFAQSSNILTYYTFYLFCRFEIRCEYQC